MRYVPQRLLVSLLFALGLFVIGTPKASADGCLLDDGATGGGGVVGSDYDCIFNGGLFDVIQPHPTGTGVIDSFLRVQQNGTEEAFNSSTRPIMCDGAECDDYKTDPNFTTDLLTSAVPITTIDGQDYLTFYLDINEPTGGAQRYLTLDQLRIYGADEGGFAEYFSDDGNAATTTDGVVGANLLFDLDWGGGTNWINLDYFLVGGGSGYGDMVALIPVTQEFLDTYEYIYLYSQFGCSADCTTSGSWDPTKKYKSADGFEEWWVPAGGGGGTDPVTPVPEPGTLALVATGIAIAIRRRKRNEAGLRPMSARIP